MKTKAAALLVSLFTASAAIASEPSYAPSEPNPHQKICAEHGPVSVCTKPGKPFKKLEKSQAQAPLSNQYKYTFETEVTATYGSSAPKDCDARITKFTDDIYTLDKIWHCGAPM